MGQIRVSPEETDPTHHLRLEGKDRLTQKHYDIPLILVNPGGKPDPLAIARNRMLTTSLKISQGNPQYSDFELPWTPLVQEDWSGGRGQEQFEDDVTRILDTYRIHTGFSNKVFMGPLERMTTGYRKMKLHIPGDMTWVSMLNSGDSKYIALPFTHDTNPLGQATWVVRKKGTPNAALNMDVCLSLSANPHLVIDTLTLAVPDDVLGEWQRIDMKPGVARTNYTKDPSMEKGDLTEWSISAGPTVTSSSDVALFGTKSMKIVTDGATNFASIYDDVSPNWFDDVSPSAYAGKTITFSFYVYIPTASGLTHAGNSLGLTAAYDIGAGWVTTVVYADKTKLDQWQRLEYTLDIPAGATKHAFYLYVDGDGAANEIVYVDGMLLEEQDELLPYFDGSMGEGYAWTGSANASTCTATATAGYPLDDGQQYWLKLYAGSALDDDANHWQVGVDSDVTSPTAKRSSDDSTYTAAPWEPYHIIQDVDDTWRAFFFHYKRGFYFYTHPDDESAISIWMNGYRGAADSNAGALGTLIDASLSLTADELVGKIAYITAGPGSAEMKPWRTITANTTGGTISVDEDWLIEHTTSTEYVILGCETWQEITGHGITTQISDLLTVDGIAYFACDEDDNIRRHRQYNNAGTWTEDWADDGTNKASRLALVHHNDTTIGERGIWRILNSTKGANRSVVKAWGTNLVFTEITSDVIVGDVEDKCNAIVQYVDPALGDKIPYFINKGSVFAMKDDIPDQIQLPEMMSVYGDYNGAGVLVHNLFLYWTMFQGGLERFYNNVVDDMGPNRDRGFDTNRQGYIKDLIGYPGRIFLAHDGGDAGYSTILMYNGDGYNELYRSSTIGQRIRNIEIQVIPGNTPDRLWFCEGQDIRYLALPSNTIDPTKDANMLYTWESAFTTSRMYAGMQDINKLYDSLKVMADELTEDVTWVEADWKIDDESNTWEPLPYPFETSPSQEMNLVEEDEDSVTGKWCQIRIRLYTADRTKTPVLRALLVNALSRIPNKFSYEVTTKFETVSKDLKGEPDDYYEDGLKRITDLDYLGDNLVVLKMSSLHKLFDNQRVVIDVPTLKPIYNSTKEQIEGYLGVIPITQVYKGEETSA